jgi:hypothetical protein
VLLLLLWQRLPGCLAARGRSQPARTHKGGGVCVDFTYQTCYLKVSEKGSQLSGVLHSPDIACGLLGAAVQLHLLQGEWCIKESE